MKIALIADIHGNLSALEAVIKDIDKRNIDKIICLGDMVGKGPNSKEVIDVCRSKCNEIVMGNWENGLYESYLSLKQGKEAAVDASSLWYINNIGEEHMNFIGGLPHTTEFCLGEKLVRLFHAHPVNFNRYFADSPIEQRLELFEPAEITQKNILADVAIYADIHKAYMQIIKGRYLVNTGSVGNPLDICQASYAILEGSHGNEQKDSFSIQFIRVAYDIAKTVTMAKQYSVPDLEGYINELKTGEYFKRK